MCEVFINHAFINLSSFCHASRFFPDTHGGVMAPSPRSRKKRRNTARYSAVAMAVAPARRYTVLYLLLPMFTAQFGVTVAEAGLLLAAKIRIVRIVGYGWVARFLCTSRRSSHRQRSPSLLHC